MYFLFTAVAENWIGDAENWTVELKRVNTNQKKKKKKKVGETSFTYRVLLFQLVDISSPEGSLPRSDHSSQKGLFVHCLISTLIYYFYL
eukprot:gene811-452_t